MTARVGHLMQVLEGLIHGGNTGGNFTGNCGWHVGELSLKRARDFSCTLQTVSKVEMTISRKIMTLVRSSRNYTLSALEPLESGFPRLQATLEATKTPK